MTVHIRFDRSDAILEHADPAVLPNISESVIVGPFEYAQLTYETLRISPGGEIVARCDPNGWTVVPASGIVHHFSRDDLRVSFSDVTVY